MLNSISKSERHLFYALIIIYILLHTHFLNAPPNGYHQWRESDTSAIILNYYQEDGNFLNQRCNQRGDGTGITGGELPTYTYSAAILYYVFGAHHYLPRLWTLLGSLIALLFFFKIVRLLSDEKKAMYATIALAFAPVFLFYSYKIMPDIWMMMFLMIAVYYFLRFAELNKIKDILISAVALFLSATLKPLGLCLFLPFSVYLLKKSPNKKKALLTLMTYCTLTFAAVLGWFMYAKYLNSIHHSEAFYMGDLILRSPEILMMGLFYQKLFLQWPFELWISWSLLPVFIYGLVKIYKTPQGKFYFIWIAACYIVFAIVAAHACSHDYYTLVIVPPIAAISGWGLAELSEKPKLKKWLMIFLIIVIPAVSFFRIVTRFADIDEFEIMRQQANEHIPKNSLVIVDETTSAIRLYQLNRRGWAFRETLTAAKIQPLINRGGEFLLLRKPIDSVNIELKSLVNVSVIQFGPLFGYKTIKPD